MLVRTSLDNGHSHTILLPPRAPAERSVFYTNEGGENLHTHALFYGGDASPGLLTTEVAGWVDGVIIPDNPTADNPHTHIVEVLV